MHTTAPPPFFLFRIPEEYGREKERKPERKGERSEETIGRGEKRFLESKSIDIEIKEKGYNCT